MKALFSLVGLVGIALTLPAADWPGYRGPNHDGSTPEKIATAWPQEGPKQLWKANLGESFGSFATGGDRAFCFVQRNVDGKDREVAVAFDVKTGKELWAVPLGEPTYDKQGGNGPRSTPTVDGGNVYFLGAFQILSCLDAATGKVRWQHDLVKEYGGQILQWNSAASPVLDGDLIYVNAGGAGKAFLAFNKKDGKLAWQTGEAKPTHASPVPATIHGVRQVIFFTQSGLIALDAKTGRQLWQHPFRFSVSTAANPIVWNDIVYCSAGYGVGGGACKVTKNGDKFSAAELWRHAGQTVNHWTTPVCKDGFLYGIFGFKEFGKGPLQCVDIATGKEMWSQPGFGTGGATILVGGTHVLAQCDKGPLVLVEASPKAYKEVARCQPLGGKCWTMAVVSDGKIFARNDKTGVCLDVKP